MKNKKNKNKPEGAVVVNRSRALGFHGVGPQFETRSRYSFPAKKEFNLMKYYVYACKPSRKLNDYLHRCSQNKLCRNQSARAK